MTDRSLFHIAPALSRADQSRFISLLESEVEPRLEKAAKGYAKGRVSAWLAWEPSLSGDSARSRPEGRLWDAIQALVPGVETAECWRNGEGSSAGIHPHRDSTYAARTAYILNLGVTSFRIWLPNDWPEAESFALKAVKVNKKLTEYSRELLGGELIRFDCKLMHGSRGAGARRWGIGMWKWNSDWKARATFDDLLSAS